MYAVKDSYLAALKSSHRVRTKVSIVQGSRTIISDVPHASASVSLDFSRDARRSLSLELPPVVNTGGFTEVRTDELLSLSGSQLRVAQGLVHADDTVEWVPQGLFRIESKPEFSDLGSSVQITGKSHEAYVVDDEFFVPRTISNPSAVHEITKLIRETLPHASIRVKTTRNIEVPAFQEESSRWGAIKKIAQAMACVVYCDGDGAFVIEDAPTLDSPHVWVARTGLGGNIVKVSGNIDRATIYNGVICRGETPSGASAPVQCQVQRDMDPSSHTRWGDPHEGAFGKKVKFVSNPAVTDLGQAEAVARAELARLTGLARPLDLSTVPNHALEAGDMILVVPDDAPAGVHARKHIIQSINAQLNAGGSFTVQTRDVRDVEQTV